MKVVRTEFFVMRNKLYEFFDNHHKNNNEENQSESRRSLALPDNDPSVYPTITIFFFHSAFSVVIPFTVPFVVHSSLSASSFSYDSHQSSDEVVYGLALCHKSAKLKGHPSFICGRSTNQRFRIPTERVFVA